jgi:hypothetical protein
MNSLNFRRLSHGPEARLTGMTELRQHITLLRAEHRSGGYVGDLAADVLDRTAPARKRWLWASAPALAAAAAVGLVLMHRPTATNPPPGAIAPSPGSIASIRPVPLGPVPVGVPIDRLPSRAVSLEFPSRPTAPAGLTLAPAFASPTPVAPPYTELRMPKMPASPWSPAAGDKRHAPTGRQQKATPTPPTSHPTHHPSQEAA